MLYKMCEGYMDLQRLTHGSETRSEKVRDTPRHFNYATPTTPYSSVQISFCSFVWLRSCRIVYLASQLLLAWFAFVTTIRVA